MNSSSILCDACGANWSAGRFTPSCCTCGDGALDRACPDCGGACGSTWKRAVADSNDRREAHWIGQCGLTGRAEWWLDESALPDLIWAALVVDGERAKVVDSDGKQHRFDSRRAAESWLREDEYERLVELHETRSVPAGVRRPPPELLVKVMDT